ncbi:MAG: MBL fold metallo-hydrolase [Collimonas sp.]|uniref:MBL fold metallo-hydrolase n=1 Tax=Collimonas sp. TaxID=1963772 RepID=UPI0032647928
MTLKISRILHAGYLFECGGTVIAFDPIVENPFSRNCHAFPDVSFDHEQVRQLKLDAVFISHFHDDHCSLESLDFLDRKTPIYLYCIFEQLFAMIRKLGFTHVHSLEIDVPVPIGAIEVIPRKALDADVDSMFHVKAAGLNVLNVVDSWIDPSALHELARFAPWDMVLWPFQTMREIEVIAPTRATAGPVSLPEEWIGQLQALNPRYVVPSSCQFVQEPWSWYNHALFPITYRQFRQDIEAALRGSRVLRLNPSVSVVLDQTSLEPAAPLSWVIPIGDQNLDYQYLPHLKPPATADIACRFAPLNDEQTALVMDFCRTGLPEKYRAMELPDDSFFRQPRLWRLTLYSHAGATTHLHYRTDGDSIEQVAASDEPLSWTTEVALSKCYAALALGESLTSMYIRINDHVFDAGNDAELASADIIDDPLIRCLFNDAIAAYQAAQLVRLGV